MRLPSSSLRSTWLASYALGNRKRDAWRAFANAYEHAVNMWPKEQPEQMHVEELPGIAKGSLEGPGNVA